MHVKWFKRTNFINMFYKLFLKSSFLRNKITFFFSTCLFVKSLETFLPRSVQSSIERFRLSESQSLHQFITAARPPSVSYKDPVVVSDMPPRLAVELGTGVKASNVSAFDQQGKPFGFRGF